LILSVKPGACQQARPRCAIARLGMTSFVAFCRGDRNPFRDGSPVISAGYRAPFRLDLL
jgi:hypothetical protein